MGGNLELVRWLVEVQGCPISVRRDPKTGLFLSVQTSESRTLIDLAMTGKPKIDILSYFVKKNLSVMDTKDASLAPKTLHTLMSAGFHFERFDKDGDIESVKLVESCDGSFSTIEDAVSFACFLLDLDDPISDPSMGRLTFNVSSVHYLLRKADGLLLGTLRASGMCTARWHRRGCVPKSLTSSHRLCPFFLDSRSAALAAANDCRNAPCARLLVTF